MDFNVLDILSVSFKESIVSTFRVFNVDDSKNWVEIHNIVSPNKCSIFPARKGFNSFSDRSGIFAFVDAEVKVIKIYSLKDKK